MHQQTLLFVIRPGFSVQQEGRESYSTRFQCTDGGKRSTRDPASVYSRRDEKHTRPGFSAQLGDEAHMRPGFNVQSKGRGAQSTWIQYTAEGTRITLDPVSVYSRRDEEHIDPASVNSRREEERTRPGFSVKPEGRGAHSTRL